MKYKQEIPPPGGYAPITFERVPLKTVFKPKVVMACLFGITGINAYLFSIFKRKENFERIEMRCAKQAIIPMVHAEVDRMLLKQLKKNREAEEKLMKEVKGWEVGKWKHYPVFLTLDPDEYFKPFICEYYAHTDRKNLGPLLNIFYYT